MAIYCHSAYLTNMQNTSCKMLGWRKHKLASRLPGEISIKINIICRWYHPYGRKWRRTKEPPDERERGERKVGLKLDIQKTKVMASGPITLQQIDGETVSDFIFLGSKITADIDRSHEIKRGLLLGRKAMTNLDSILKSRDIRMAAIQKSTSNKCWRECGEKGTLLHCWWECKLVQPLWRTGDSLKNWK